MTIERTLCIIKPDATVRGDVGGILERIEQNGLKVVTKKRLKLKESEARAFYEEHQDQPFFPELVSYMSSGEVVIAVLEGVGAIAIYRTLMGATNPQEAKENTLRKIYGQSLNANAVHGSDSTQSANREIAFFFGTTY